MQLGTIAGLTALQREFARDMKILDKQKEAGEKEE
jgi:hypothetical protein